MIYHSSIVLIGGNCGVMVIVIGNGLTYLSSNSWTRLFLFHEINTLGKGMNPTISPHQWINSRAD